MDIEKVTALVTALTPLIWALAKLGKTILDVTKFIFSKKGKTVS